MDLNTAHLDTLVAIADTGSFEAASRQLQITPSAVSQRIRALEASAGQVLVTRGTPCHPTVAGGDLVRLGRQTRLLHEEARRSLAAGPVSLRVAVNADSLATWFRNVLGEVATWEGVALQLFVRDQAHSQALLREGSVAAAITSDGTPVQGCSVESLGAFRYYPVATPALIERHRTTRGIDWERLPMLVFDELDELQWQLLQRRSRAHPLVTHRVPTSADFAEAVNRGLGWGALPVEQCSDALAAGRLVTVTREHVDVPLYLQRWRLSSPWLDRFADVVRRTRRERV